MHEVDQVDRRLLHALQIEPRASWSSLAPVVGVDPATLSRRWQRLREEGLVWITGLIQQGSYNGLAYVELNCDPAVMSSVLENLKRDGEVTTIDRTAGSSDLYLSVVSRSLSALRRYTDGRLASVEGVRSFRMHVVTDLMQEGGAWRLRELTANEISRIRPIPLPRPRAARMVSDELQKILEYELAVDGRTPSTEIAERWGISSQRVNDAIAVLRANGVLRMRTDIARSISDWPVYAWYFIEAPAKSVLQLQPILAAVPEIRLAVRTASRYNLILAVWVRDLAAIHTFETALERAAPGIRIADRSIVLQVVKHLGRILTDDGRASGPIVPIAIRPLRGNGAPGQHL